MSNYFAKWKPEEFYEYINNLKSRVARSDCNENYKKELYDKITLLEEKYENGIKEKYLPIIKNALEGIAKALNPLMAKNVHRTKILINNELVKNQEELLFWTKEIMENAIEANKNNYDRFIFSN